MDNKEEVRRLHEDWWGKCRTCRHWRPGPPDPRHGERWNDGKCSNEQSDLHGKTTTTDGYWRKWDSYDIDVALELLQEWEEEKARRPSDILASLGS